MSNTIKAAVVQILKKSHTGLTPKEIYAKIVEQHLYEFQAKTPISVVAHVLRKSCVGVNMKLICLHLPDPVCTISTIRALSILSHSPVKQKPGLSLDVSPEGPEKPGLTIW